MVQIIGRDLTDRPVLDVVCEPVLVPRAGKYVTSFLWFVWEGEELVGRPRPPYRSTLEIRLRRVASSAQGVDVAGTVAGFAEDEDDRFLGRLDTAFGIPHGERAQIEGRVSPTTRNAPGEFLGGTIRGSVTFFDSSGALSRCPEASILMQVQPGDGV